MKILVTGASGLLGSHLAAAYAGAHEVVGIDQHPWWSAEPVTMLQGDLRDRAWCARTVAAQSPDVILHCAAIVDVDGCERSPADAYEMNGTVTGVLARAAKPGSLFVYVTTDSLFRGDRAFAAETDLPCPLTVYARSKLNGEWETQIATPDHLVVRTNFFGWSSGIKATFGEWLYGALERLEPITLFDDSYFTPIYVADLVDAVRELVAGGHRGTFNVCGSERVSKYEFASELARQAGFSLAAARRGSLTAANLAATRPGDMSLDVSKCERAIGRRLPGVAEGIARFLAGRGLSLARRVARSVV